MIVISNHLVGKIPLPSYSVIRVNLAWIKDLEEANKILVDLTEKGYDVYLDYPQGRTKPPKPTLTKDDAIDLANKYPIVKYFAISNIEDAYILNELRTGTPLLFSPGTIGSKLRNTVELIPKIETKRGIENLDSIVRDAKIKCAMLDKEDLYTDVSRDSLIYEALISLAKQKAKDLNIELLELQGVVFA